MNIFQGPPIRTFMQSIIGRQVARKHREYQQMVGGRLFFKRIDDHFGTIHAESVGLLGKGSGYQPEIYGAFFCGRLNRPTPHLLFASKLLDPQLPAVPIFHFLIPTVNKMAIDISLEKVFTVYMPRRQEVEVLSFLTPELIEVMLKLKYHNIELLDNKLVCYVPSLKPEALADFKRQCRNLLAEFNDNLHVPAGCSTPIDPANRRLRTRPTVHVWIGAFMTVGGPLLALIQMPLRRDYSPSAPIIAAVFMFLFGLGWLIYGIYDMKRGGPAS